MGYTHDWNGEFKSNISRMKLNNKSLDLCLEIGVFEGLTSNFICDNILSENGKLICVDPLTDSYLNTDLNEKDVKNNQTIYKYFNSQYGRFIENTKNQFEKQKIELIRELSSVAFPILLEKYKNSFDLIYIDGDHRASAVYIDAVNSYSLCKPKGHIIFDDYSWGKMYNDEATSVGIDKFLKEYEGKYEIISKGYQVVIRKNDTII